MLPRLSSRGVQTLVRFVTGNGDVHSLNFKQLQAVMKSSPRVMVVDVREPKELAEGKIPPSVNIPLGELKTAFQMPAAAFEKKVNCAKPELGNVPIILHCKSGKRAITGAKILLELGYKDVSVFPGGVKEWEEQSQK